MIVFTLIWSVIVLIFDGVLIVGAWRFHDAQSYSEAAGRVTHSELESSSDSDGTTYRAEIHFEYTVDEERYEGDNYRPFVIGSSDSSEARRAVKNYPVGKEVIVYYHPDVPERSVLERNITAMELFIPLFLMPFNMVMLFLWGSTCARFLPRSDAADTVGGYRLRDDGLRQQIRLDASSPFMAAMVTFGVCAFASIFIVAFLVGFESVAAVKAVWIILLGIAGMVYLTKTFSRLRGNSDLVIDESRGVVRLPKYGMWGNPRTDISPGSIQGVFLRWSNSGTKVNGKSARELVIRHEDAYGETQERPIAYRFEQPEHLEQVRIWLSERLGLADDEEASEADGGLDLSMDA